jgi:hypothetical protein
MQYLLQGSIQAQTDSKKSFQKLLPGTHLIVLAPGENTKI